MRIAEGLASYHTVYVAQQSRTETEISNQVHYISTHTAHALSPHVVILLRQTDFLKKIGDAFPHAKHFLWMHDTPSFSLYSARHLLAQYHYDIISVSHFHQQRIQYRLQGRWYQKLFSYFRKTYTLPVHVLYNPIDDDRHPDETPRNPNKMLSLGWKGIPQTVQLFKKIRATFPSYHLVIASYSKWDDTLPLPDQVTFLGSLSQSALTKQMRESFCIFHPQTQVPETFGLIYTESNAVGTPVLAHDFGAAREVLGDPAQLINGHDVSTITTKIQEWQTHYPVVSPPKEKFRLKQIVEQWLALLSST